jgi:hypothetical protein
MQPRLTPAIVVEEDEEGSDHLLFQDDEESSSSSSSASLKPTKDDTVLTMVNQQDNTTKEYVARASNDSTKLVVEQSTQTESCAHSNDVVLHVSAVLPPPYSSSEELELADVVIKEKVIQSYVEGHGVDNACVKVNIDDESPPSNEDFVVQVQDPFQDGEVTETGNEERTLSDQEVVSSQVVQSLLPFINVDIEDNNTDAQPPSSQQSQEPKQAVDSLDTTVVLNEDGGTSMAVTPLPKKLERINLEDNNDINNGDDGGDDDTATQPETPDKDEFTDHYALYDVNGDSLDRVEQGQAKSPSKTKRGGMNKKLSTSPNKDSCNSTCEKDNKHVSVAGHRCRFRCTLCLYAMISLVLMGCIAILGYTLYAVRNDQEPSFFGLDLSAWFRDMIGRGNDDAPFVDAPPTLAPSNNNTNGMEVDPELLAMVRDTIVVATGDSGSVPGIVSLETVLDDPTTRQYSVLAWLANDPSVLNYSGTKILQRYVLGCFFWSLQDVNTDRHVLDTWMTYEDECEFWKTTGSGEFSPSLCNETSGKVDSIHLENIGLSGTISPELALLSNSLGM